ncbi:methionine/alanine import family NSS transporter small subunit [Streptomyces alkaliterrae]|uniref:Methionine/alanine import family NSS transporter small subunit n=1 Tax=Streptomyces alkaliterrae TaxID=2213162 RepID=A0A5P0YUR3_9ACTN|nr:methionine/alanine import family NSS transporter small subunit [Streptomyces alkaliterrae]MBB1255290.1 methionine/alanine import family NSS transporter small subunit [Streptomyces alkaliterrae]MBB1260522.1 methionine/alanine import family NSS transporter small subunit [Streptomyces alkaliterrae]MQS04033.1 methionine/alanine import family NSS transporter small subunit [Streptomyces alkaliterrae]
MSASAVTMMVISIVLIWGGLAAAIWKLRGHPEEVEPLEDTGRPVGD